MKGTQTIETISVKLETALRRIKSLEKQQRKLMPTEKPKTIKQWMAIHGPRIKEKWAVKNAGKKKVA